MGGIALSGEVRWYYHQGRGRPHEVLDEKRKRLEKTDSGDEESQRKFLFGKYGKKSYEG